MVRWPAALLVLTLVAAWPLAGTERSPRSVLVLDLEGDGIYLAGPSYAVLFDLDGDGRLERTAWTAARRSEAFLWIDTDGNGRVDGGLELLGSRPGPEAVPVRAYRRLIALDEPARGGNGDGELTDADRGWSELRLWIDRDHDGRSLPAELSKPADWGLRSIALDFRELLLLDGSGSLVLAGAEFSTSTSRSAGKVLEIQFARP